VWAARINKKKSRPEPMPTATFGYAFPANIPASPSAWTTLLRRLVATLAVVAVVLGVVGILQLRERPGDKANASAVIDPLDPAPGPTEAPSVTAAPSPRTGMLRPARAEAIAVDDSARLVCPPRSLVTFTADNLIDQDPNTGWWASADDDGAGRFAVISFPSTVRLTQVGLVPGYTHLGPRADQDCRVANAFPFNRFIEVVQYDFDDGTSVEQRFEPQPRMQTRSVDATTKNVRITILRTSLPAGADNDTLISDTYFAGAPLS
jgi:hypothetical protein